MSERSEAQEIESVTQALCREFGVDPAVAREIVQVEHARWRSVRVRTFVPTLVHRNATLLIRTGANRSARTA